MSMAVVAMVFAGCTKEKVIDLTGDLSGYATTEQLEELRQQLDNKETTQLYEFSIDFPAVDNEHFSQVQYNGLVGKVEKNDAMLVYCNLAGAWTQLPYCLDNTAIAYWRTDDGTLYFRYGRANYVEFSQDAVTMQMRAIVIPQNIYVNLKGKGTDLGSYEAVIDACREMNYACEMNFTIE